jgi:hypothetical protein
MKRRDFIMNLPHPRASVRRAHRLEVAHRSLSRIIAVLVGGDPHALRSRRPLHLVFSEILVRHLQGDVMGKDPVVAVQRAQAAGDRKQHRRALEFAGARQDPQLAPPRRPSGVAQAIALDRGASPPQPVAPTLAAPSPDANGVSHCANESSQPAKDAMPEAGVDRHQAAPKPRTVVRDEAVMRDHFRHRSELDLFRQALFGDDDQRPVAVESAKSTEFNFDTFCATISAMYGRYGLCPPFRLRNFASAWIADDITPEHCLAVIDRFLREHAPSRRSGSLDGLLPYLDKLLRFEWNRAQLPQRRRPEPRPRNSIDDYTT